jgi:chromosome segregation ATPase
MRGISSIFGKNEPAKAEQSMAVESFECVDDDGRFCLVRATAGASDAFKAQPVRLIAASDGSVHRFAAVEGDDEGVAEFVVPSSFLTGRTFAIETGEEWLALPDRTRPLQAAGEASGEAIHEAHLAQQEQLADHSQRLTELRASLRAQRDRTAAAEDELQEARTRFDATLLSNRSELHALRERAGALESESVATAEARAVAARERALREEQEARLSAVADEASAAAEHLAERVGILERELAEARAEISARAEEIASSRERDDAAAQERDELRRALEAEQALRGAADERVEEAAGHAADQSARVDAAVAALEEERSARALAEAQAEATAADLEEARIDRKRANDLLEEERTTRSELEARLGTAEASAEEAGQRIAELVRDNADIDERNTALESALAEAREALQVQQAEHGTEREERLGEIAQAQQRISELERESAESEARRESLEAVLAEARSALEQERIERAETDARLEAAEQALSENRSARYRAEQQVHELSAALAATESGGGVPAPAQREPAPTSRAPELIPSELTANGAAPWVSSESLSALDFDGLAEVYDIAAEAWRTHGRVGNHAVADSWRVVARNVVDEAATREDSIAAGNGPRGRRLARRQDRIRDQLREACAERLTDGGG